MSETCTHCPHAVHSGPCRKTSAFTPGGCLCVQYPELRLPHPTPAEPRTMRLPKNAAHPNFNEVHKEDDWCARAGCTVVCDSWPPAGKMETPAEPRIETLSTFSVPMADVIRVIEALTGPTGGWLDSPRVVLGKIREHAELWRARAGSSPASEDLRGGYVSFPLEFREPKTDNDGPYIYDANGKQVAMLFWPTHPIEETEAAEQATYRLGRAMAEAGRSRSDSYIKVPPLRFGACQICWTCSWAPCEESTPESFKVGDDEWVICQLCDANRRLRLASPPSSPGAAQTGEKCPSCGGTDNNPYETEYGVKMRACGRCVIQWVASSPGAPQEQK